MKHMTKVLEFTTALAIGMFALHSTADAANISERQALFHPNKIVGLWDVEVIVADCETGDAGEPFHAMHQYDMGGTGQVVPATNPAMLSAHLTVWSHVRRNDYRQVVKFYRFNPAGEAVGYNIIRNDITISQDGTEYMGSGVADFFTLGGDYMFSACPSFIGTRISSRD